LRSGDSFHRWQTKSIKSKQWETIDENGGIKMEQKMFCYQCEQTAGCTGCTGSRGVCGKTAQTAQLQDELTGALIGLARATIGDTLATEETWNVMITGLFATLTNVSFDDAAIREQIAAVHRAKDALVPQCQSCGAPCGRNDDYDLRQLWEEPDEDIRSLKSLILFGLRGMAAYAYHAMVLGYRDAAIDTFFSEALCKVGETFPMEELLQTALKVGEVNLQCMALLDKANTETFGTPSPKTVSMKIEKGPFIVVTGHDLRDLQLLLEQTKDKGISIYTHGEMLPAHAYPKLNAYPHLKGNFGTAWQNQQKEFADLPAPILFTTNCLMPPKGSYADRVFTTEAVAFPDAVHIGEEKDFTPLIEKALELGGYSEDRQMTGINGGTTVTTGFGHGTILSVAEQVVAGVRSGAIRHFFLVGGCDGAKTGRNYYTEFVKQTPKDSIVLTLACGKYRFNDLDLGTIGGLPRLMDMGQCNDAYGAIQVAVALSQTFGCSVNELPLSYVLSWYEQKAVCILLTLLHLGIQNIRLGPSLPAFLSERAAISGRTLWHCTDYHTGGRFKGIAGRSIMI
jgi:hydroxylamine reductase